MLRHVHLSGLACALTGLGGFLMPEIVRIEENHNGRVVAQARMSTTSNQVI